MDTHGVTQSELPANLLLQEYISLKAEIRDMVTETGTLAKYSIIFTGAFAAFLLKEKQLWIPGYFDFLPAIFTALLAVRSTIIGIHIGRIGTYIRVNIEPEFDYLEKMKGMGWERYYYNYQMRKLNMSILGVSFTAFWSLNLLATIIIGCWLTKY